LSVVNIDGDRELEDQFIFRVPVVYMNGQLIAEGQVTAEAIRLALRQIRDMGVAR
jgi:alkyl hydroperoxide reductase subunit AhpF